MSLRVLIVDDHQIVRDGLKNLLKSESDIEVVGEADNGRMALELTQKLVPDAVIMDISMAQLNGVDATRQIVEMLPHVKVVALSMHDDKRFVGRMLEAGARGYLLKDCAFSELIQALHTVMGGHIYLSPTISGVVVKDYVSHITSEGSHKLTSREKEILQLIAEGKSAKEIAAVLNVSVKTVETHRLHLMDKLNLHSVAEITKYALREGITSL